jgi:long-chain-fatty-acid--[acyl-carrier-protein] ligase
MGFLPPFHAFGLTITTLLPLLTGIKVAYSPNPTHTSALKRHIKNWKPSLICGTPTFFKNLLSASQPEDLSSLNTYITGAEACPNTLKKELQQHGEHILVLEGYGMTEAGPVLCLQNPETSSEGVGAPLDNIELIIVDPNTHQILSQGKTGLILAKGPNFFSGYYHSDKNPWIEIQSEKWYNTGDLGKLNQKGELILEGRLSRFIKVAGEMISLPALESTLHQKFSDKEGIELVLIPQEKEGERPILTLFSNLELDLKSTNQLLRDAGFSALSRIHQCKIIESIPTLGTGKTNYKELQEILEQEAA